MRSELAPIAFIASASLLLPLPWHWRAGNVATLAIMFWLFVANMIYAIDAVIWSGNVNIVATVWCDITTKLIIGSNIALPAACLCICIHLEQVASVRLARTSQSDKRRRQIFEALMCFALPVLYMALHYTVQGHRFDIIEDYGCRPTVYFSIPSIFLIWIPPILLSLASLVFGGLALRHFIHRRISFAAHLDASRSALTTSRYLRLMLMSILEMIWSIAVTIYTLWFTTVSIPIRPYTSWADVHSNFSRVDTYPTLFMPELVVTAYYFLWWLVPISTFAFVAMFAFGRDALDEYKRCFRAVRDAVLRHVPHSASVSKGGLDTRTAIKLPSYEPKTGVVGSKATVSASTYPPSPTASKFREALNELDYDSSYSETSSQLGHALSYQGSESPTSSSPDTPSTTSPQPARSSSRPVTYPSFDPLHRSINSSAQ
ncbi:pheromone receptor Rcb2 B43 [Mycena galericulata]|nr:pheromone receptor Rcb2 B43 [Mycena galericulata]